MKKFMAAMAAVAMVFVATASAAAAKAEGQWVDMPIYLSASDVNPCTGSPIMIAGPGMWHIHWLEIDQRDGARFHWNIRTELDLATSDGFIGEHYLARSTVNKSAPFPEWAEHYVESQVINIRFENPDSGQAFRVKANFHITVMNFDEVTAYVDSWSAKCLGG